MTAFLNSDDQALFRAESIRLTANLEDFDALFRTKLLLRRLPLPDQEALNRAEVLYRDLGPETVSTRLIELKSKEACPVCGAHKIYTNDSESIDSTVRWHCLNCNYTFTESASQRESVQNKSCISGRYSQWYGRVPDRDKVLNFWNKADRIVVMIIGGISIGAAFAQLPGLIVGGLCGAGYGWYVSFSSDRFSQR